MTRTDYLNEAILRTNQALIMRRENLIRTSLIAKEMAKTALRKARGI